MQNKIIAFFSEQLNSPENNLGMSTEDPAWEDFILGAASGADPIFNEFKEAVGREHYTPLELFQKGYPDIPACSKELSVLCWVFPQREQVRFDNKQQKEFPSESWGRSKLYGEKFYISMGLKLEKFFAQNDIPALFPMGHPEFVKLILSDKYFIASNWSERHACYAAGLGTFGLCDGLITPVGKAHRCGSIIIKHVLPAVSRKYTSHHAYCPWFTNGACGACIKRCPVGALSEKGHDKEKCRKYLHGACAEHLNSLGLDVHACGLCQTGVPCESSIPGQYRPDTLRGFLE